MKKYKSIFGASREQLYCACAGTVYHADTERSCDGKPGKRNYVKFTGLPERMD